MAQIDQIARAKQLVEQYGEEFVEPQQNLSYLVITLDVGGPPINISYCNNDGSLQILEDDLLILKFDSDGIVTKGDTERALSFLARLLDEFVETL